MDDTKHEGMVCNGCGSHGCGNYGGGHHGHFALRLLLGIVIIAIVFWMGVKVGELKGWLESDFHSTKMMRYYDGYNNSGMRSMMNGEAPTLEVQ